MDALAELQVEASAALEGRRLNGASRVELGLHRSDSEGLTVYVRTAPAFTQVLDQTARYEYPTDLLHNAIAICSSLRDLIDAQRVMLFASEPIACALDIAHSIALGVVIDEARKVAVVPDAGTKNALALQASGATPSGVSPWLLYLLHSSWFLGHDRPWLQIIHLPDQDPTDDQLERAISMSIGWNLIDVHVAGGVAAEVEQTRQALAAVEIV